MRSTFAKGHFRKMTEPECGNSSVGRARPCQGRGREFESRFPLQFFSHHQVFIAGIAQLVEHVPRHEVIAKLGK